MTRLLGLALALTASAAGVTMSISPELVTECNGSLGQVSLAWTQASGPAEVRVGSPQGPSMTGLLGPDGSAMSGDWVTDGMVFYLVNARGTVEAQVTARVRCQGALPRSESFYPLQIGNQWVHRSNSRAITSEYTTYTVTATEDIGGLTYYKIQNSAGATVFRLRSDAQGRIFNSEGRQVLDPAAGSRTTHSGVLGVFPDAIRISESGFTRDENVYVRGIGLVSSRSTLIAGSSGGFLSGAELVEARLDGGVRLVIPVPQFSLSIDKTVLDVTGRNVDNCAIPSYCVACGLAGADPPGTYKPCVQVRVEGLGWAEVQLRNAAGQTAFRAAPEPGTLRYLQVPLYSKPNEPIPAGVYTLTAKVEGKAEASITVRIE